MNIQEKVSIIDKAKEEYGLNLACEAVDLPKASWYYHKNQKVDYKEKYNYLKPIMEEIIREFPEYGYPRIKTELQEEYGLVVNHKVILRLLNLWDLKIMRAGRNNEKSAVKKAIETAGAEINLIKKLEDIGLFEVSYTDFTRIIYDNGSKSAWLIPIVGHKSKMVYGWSLGPYADTESALKALDMTIETFKAMKIDYEGMILHQDQDSVFTGSRWVQEVLVENKIRLSYTENGARDNPAMESFNSHFKCPNKSLFLDAGDLSELKEVIKERVIFWNERRRHSVLENKKPLEYVMEMRGIKTDEFKTTI